MNHFVDLAASMLINSEISLIEIAKVMKLKAGFIAAKKSILAFLIHLNQSINANVSLLSDHDEAIMAS